MDVGQLQIGLHPLGDLSSPRPERPQAAPYPVGTTVPADELAAFCLHALTAAGALRAKAAVDRLVEVTVTGLMNHGVIG